MIAQVAYTHILRPSKRCALTASILVREAVMLFIDASEGRAIGARVSPAPLPEVSEQFVEFELEEGELRLPLEHLSGRIKPHVAALLASIPDRSFIERYDETGLPECGTAYFKGVSLRLDIGSDIRTSAQYMRISARIS